MRIRAGSGLLFLVALALTLGGLPSLEQSVRHVAATTTFTVSPNPAMTGEKVRMSGGLASAVARPVVLQRLSRGSWVKVVSAKSTATGRFSFTRTAPSTAATFRVRAPAATINGRRWAAITTPQRKLGIAAQKVVVTAPTPVTQGARTTVTATLTPVRSERYVDFQQYVGGTWQTVDTRRTTTAGKASTTVEWPLLGNQRVRARARAFNGAPAKLSPEVAVVVQTAQITRLYRYTRSATGGTLAAGGDPIRMSADGRRILWGTGTAMRIFDRETRASTTLARPVGLPSDAFVWTASRNLRHLTFERSINSTTNEVWVWNRDTGSLVSLSRNAGDTHLGGKIGTPELSDDGRYVAFPSTSNNLVAADPNPNGEDVFLRDLETGTTTVVNGPNFEPGSQQFHDVRISGDGSTVLYMTYGGNLEAGLGLKPVYAVWRSATSTTKIVRVGTAVQAGSSNAGLSPLSTDGTKALVQLADAQGFFTTYVADVGNGTGVAVPDVPSPRGDAETVPLYPDSISGDGTTITGNVSDIRWLGPGSEMDVGDVYTWKVGGPKPFKVTKRASDGSWSRGVSCCGELSETGRWLTFSSDAEDLVAGDTDNNGVNDGFLWDTVG